MLENLYFGYTQFSLWDLSATRGPFRDTNYRPSLFYYLSDTGVQNRVIRRLSLAAGLEHESNGRDGDQSRSINTVFVKPTFYLGDMTNWHWSVSPKLYYYIEKNDNSDIASYRGYMDLKLAYGKPDSWEFATTLRKGTQKVLRQRRCVGDVSAGQADPRHGGLPDGRLFRGLWRELAGLQPQAALAIPAGIRAVALTRLTGQRLAASLQPRVGHRRGKLALPMPAGGPPQLLALVEEHEDRDAVQAEALAQLRVRIDVGVQPVQLQRPHRRRIGQHGFFRHLAIEAVHTPEKHTNARSRSRSPSTRRKPS